MGETLTIRTDDDLRQALRQRAAADEKTVSQVVREILEEALMKPSMADRVGHLRGCLEAGSSEIDDPWRQQLRERNWRS